VHDLNAIRKGGTDQMHGFRLHLGTLRSEEKVLMALQLFARFLGTHRAAKALEGAVRRTLQQGGLAGAIDIIMGGTPQHVLVD
jgi:hypothetical protein